MVPVPVHLSTTLYIEEDELDQPLLVKLAVVPRNFTSSDEPSCSSPVARRFAKLSLFDKEDVVDSITQDNCLVVVERITEVGMWMIDMINEPPTPRIDRGMHPLHWYQKWEKEQKEPIELLAQDPELDAILIYCPPEHEKPRAGQGRSVQRRSESMAESDTSAHSQSSDTRSSVSSSLRSTASSALSTVEEYATIGTASEPTFYPACPVDFILTDWDADEHFWIDHEHHHYEASHPSQADLESMSLDSTGGGKESGRRSVLKVDRSYLYVPDDHEFYKSSKSIFQGGHARLDSTASGAETLTIVEEGDSCSTTSAGDGVVDESASIEGPLVALVHRQRSYTDVPQAKYDYLDSWGNHIDFFYTVNNDGKLQQHRRSAAGRRVQQTKVAILGALSQCRDQGKRLRSRARFQKKKTETLSEEWTFRLDPWDFQS
jgi:hypothetical protein